MKLCLPSIHQLYESAQKLLPSCTLVRGLTTYGRIKDSEHTKAEKEAEVPQQVHFSYFPARIAKQKSHAKSLEKKTEAELLGWGWGTPFMHSRGRKTIGC